MPIFLGHPVLHEIRSSSMSGVATVVVTWQDLTPFIRTASRPTGSRSATGPRMKAAQNRPTKAAAAAASWRRRNFDGDELRSLTPSCSTSNGSSAVRNISASPTEPTSPSVLTSPKRKSRPGIRTAGKHARGHRLGLPGGGFLEQTTLVPLSIYSAVKSSFKMYLSKSRSSQSKKLLK